VQVIAVDEPDPEMEEPAEDDPGIEQESAEDSAESFESAVPAPPIKRQNSVGENGTTRSDTEKLPDVESVVAKIPDETRLALKELFRAEFSEVRRITKDELR
jgi:hypothetical protein